MPWVWPQQGAPAPLEMGSMWYRPLRLVCMPVEAPNRAKPPTARIQLPTRSSSLLRAPRLQRAYFIDNSRHWRALEMVQALLHSAPPPPAPPIGRRRRLHRSSGGPVRCSTAATRILELDSGAVAVAPTRRRPNGVVHFLGGAFVGAAPLPAYSLLLERLATGGYTCVATPYAVTFQHVECARAVHTAFEGGLAQLRRESPWAAPLDAPLHGLGHSNGSLLHLLIGALLLPGSGDGGPAAGSSLAGGGAGSWQQLPTEQQEQQRRRQAEQLGGGAPRASNILCSFNNFQVGRAVPVPLGMLRPAVEQLRGGAPGGRLEAAVGAGLRGAAAQLALAAPAGLVEGLRQLDPAVVQLGSVFDEVGDGCEDFSPSPSEARQIIAAGYRVPATMLVKFTNDDTDETPEAAAMLAGSGGGGGREVSAFFNPAILIAEAVRGRAGSAGDVLALLAAELAGWFVGGTVLWLFYLPHLNAAVALPAADEVDRLLRDPAALSDVALLTASYTLGALLNASYTLGALLNASYTLGALLNASYTLGALLSASYTLGALLNASNTLGALLNASYTLGALLNASYTLGALLNASYTLGALLNASYTLGALLNASYTLGAPASPPTPASFLRWAAADLRKEVHTAWNARRLADPFRTCPEELRQACEETSGYLSRTVSQQQLAAAEHPGGGAPAVQLAAALKAAAAQRWQWGSEGAELQKQASLDTSSGGGGGGGGGGAWAGDACVAAAADRTEAGAWDSKHGRGSVHDSARDGGTDTYAERLRAEGGVLRSMVHMGAALCKARQDVVLSVFVTRPAIWSPFINLMQKFVATTIMATAALLLFEQGRFMDAAAASAWPPQAGLLVGLLNTAAILSLGGTTGPALNPARDLGPRLAFHLLPIPERAALSGITHGQPSQPAAMSGEDKHQGVFQGKTSDVDRRHGDPDQGGLTSGEKSAVSRGYMPKTAEGDEGKQEAAQQYAQEKGVELDKGPQA
ncbi:plant MCA23-20 [Micractinium conductrix]|uniref:Plant MCA23-20 n=1 Tax=Micractinium conductrix TaxID=554055 RepID=A0A2P6V333_9CHLO|nr:plant MCA23-20 [Micractinium conductrix]|eukprot:PSC68501.1 plant MCA23-20 [Micractinium conductrix]